MRSASAWRLAGVLMFAGTLSMVGIVQAQVHQGIWFVLAQPLGFVLYGIAAVAEVNRAPFDLPEAEQELVAGYLTEFSGLRWSLFQMAEYINMITASSVVATLFFGGWTLGALDGMPGLPVHLVLHQGRVLPVRLHLAARDAAAHPLRSVDALRLAGACCRSSVLNVLVTAAVIAFGWPGG